MPICPTKQMQNWRALSCVLWLRRTEKGKFQKPIICAIMQDRAVIYAKSQLGSFFGNKEQSGFAPRNRKDGTHKTGENRMSWGRIIRLGKNSCSCTMWKRCCFWWKKIAQYAKTCYTEVASANCTKLFPSTRQKENEKGRVFGYESIGSETAEQF